MTAKTAASLIVAASIGLLVAACDSDDGGGETTATSLTDDVLPIVQARCGGCHTRTDPPPFPNAVANGVYWETKDDVLSKVGSSIVAGDSAGSLFVKVLTQEQAVGMGPTVMPPPAAGPAVPAAEVDVIRAWIDEGALDG